MTINTIKFPQLHNDEHFKFHSDFKRLIQRYGADALKIQDQFNAYLPLFDKVDEGIKKITKSLITADIEEADNARDEIWRGIISTNNAGLNHFDNEVQRAANRLKIVFDTYGNIAKLTMIKQTSAIFNILQELQGKYAPDVSAVGLERWVTELAVRNNKLDDLLLSRNDEKVQKSDVVVKEARTALDEAYRTILTRISAFVTIEGAESFEPFIRDLNVAIDNYTAILARRAGKKGS